MSGFLFVVRLYFYGGSEQIKMVHSFIYDGDQKKDFIRSLGIRFDVPMREALYNRHIAFRVQMEECGASRYNHW